MSSYKQTKWKYKPLSDRRRDDGDDQKPRASGSADPEIGRSSTSQLQRSSSLVYQRQDLLSSQIKDFLQRTDNSFRRSKSRSVDTASVRELRLRDGDSRSGTLSPPGYYRSRDRSISSREHSIWEEGEEQDVNEFLDRKRDSVASVALSNTSVEGLNGTDNENDTVSRNRYENLKKQFQSSKMKMTKQHQMELDNLLTLKKQLERRLYDSYESLDEQKQISCQWKKKYAKLSSEISEMKLQLDDQLSQKRLNEIRRRKEESDFQYSMDEFYQEKRKNERLMDNIEIITQEKMQLEDNLNDLKDELMMKTSKIKILNEEVNCSKANVTETELEHWKKTNNNLKKKCAQLEEELEKNLRQIDALEEGKHKMEQNVDKMRKQYKQELSQKDDELDEVRYNMEKKMKALHCQLEQENYEKTVLIKEKLKLERQIDDLHDNVSQSQSTASSILGKMKNKLIKTKALLKDERSKDQGISKERNNVLLRKLKNQLDGVELEKLTAIKSKQKYELEYADLSNYVAEIEKNKLETERKLENAIKAVDGQHKLLDEKEEELNQVMTKFTSTTQQISENRAIINEITDKMSNLEHENATLVEKIATLQVKLENKDSLAISSSRLQEENFKAKVKELESKNELDKATISRRELQLSQLSSQLEKAQCENDKAQKMLNETAREVKSYNRQIKDLQEEVKKLTIRESDLLMRNKDLAVKVEAVETEKNMTNAELKLANERIIQLKEAMDESTSCLSDSSTESINDTTISIVTMDDFKYRSESPDSISALSESEVYDSCATK